jgi:hypothetical protein
MYTTRLLPIFTTPRIGSLNHDERLPVLIVLGLFVCNELRVTGGHATLDHVDTHDPVAGLQTRQVRLRLFVELKVLGLYSRHVLG